MPARSVSETLSEYARGIAGGLLFSIAPLYTMEIWWQGFVLPPGRTLLSVIALVVLLVGYAYYAGVHDNRTLTDNVLEAFEMLAIGYLLAVLVLTLSGQLPGTLSLYETVSRIVAEGSATSIGVAVGSTQLGSTEDAADSGQSYEGSMLHEFAFAVLGGMMLSLGIAPTQEIVRIAVDAAPWTALATVVFSFLLALGMVSYAQFKGSKRIAEAGIFAGGPLGDAAVTYAIALGIAAGLLWLGGAFEGYGLSTCVQQTVYLAVPTTLGSAAGRLLL